MFCRILISKRKSIQLFCNRIADIQLTKFCPTNSADFARGSTVPKRTRGYFRARGLRVRVPKATDV